MQPTDQAAPETELSVDLPTPAADSAGADEPKETEAADQSIQDDPNHGQESAPEQAADEAPAEPAPEAPAPQPDPAPAPVVEPPAPPAAPVADPTPAPAPAPAPQAPVVVIGGSPSADLPFPHDEFELPLSASTTARVVVQELKDYIEALGTGKIIPADKGAGAQAGLYRALIGTVNMKAEEFDTVMHLVLKLITKHRDTIFHERNVFRFMPHLTMPKQNVESFRALVNMFIALADPQSRGLAVKQVDFERTLNHRTIKEDARQRVMRFFHVA